MCIFCELAFASNTSAAPDGNQLTSISAEKNLGVLPSSVPGYAWFNLNFEERNSFLEINSLGLSYTNFVRSSNVFTFSFPAAAPQVSGISRYNITGGTDSAFTENQKVIIRNQLEILSRFINIEFREVNEGGDINFLYRDLNIGGYAQRYSGKLYAFMDSDWQIDSYFSLNLTTVLHELGHLLGLDHPLTYRINEPVQPPNITAPFDSTFLTVMSYAVAFLNNTGAHSYMPLDMSALIKIYGHSRAISPVTFIFNDLDQFPTIRDNKITYSIHVPSTIASAAAQNVINLSALTSAIEINLKEGTIRSANFDPVKFFNIRDSGGQFVEPASIVFVNSEDAGRQRIPNSYIEKNTSITSILGTSQSDTIILDDIAVVVSTGRGNDLVSSGAGNDVVDGGLGVSRSDDELLKYLEKLGFMYNTSNGNFYKYFDSPVTWAAAKQSALSEILPTLNIKGHLATLDEIGEHQFVATQMAKSWNAYSKFPWLGIELNNGNWIWSDGPNKGKIASEVYWSPGNPDNYNGVETKAQWWWSSRVNDNYEFNRFPFLVEFETRMFFDSEGQDTFVLSGRKEEYLISKISDGISISDKVKGRDGSDKLISIERIDFTDGDLIFDVTSAGAPAAYRLYGGAFDRTPDEGGFRFWTSYLDKNASLHTVATEFIRSPEFIARYGASLSNAAFVDALYQNVLHRGGDTGGLAYWNQQLDTKARDRPDVLVQFTQLPEFVGISAANIDNGYWVV